MKSTRFDTCLGHHLPRELQLKRLRSVIQQELTELQRYTLVAYYFENRSLTQIAQSRNVCKSTVCRTLKRAEEKIRRILLH